MPPLGERSLLSGNLIPPRIHRQTARFSGLTSRSSRARFAASLMRYRVPQRAAATQAGLTPVLGRMEATQSSNNLFRAVRDYWSYFAPAWAFPVVFYLFGVSGALSQATFIFVVMPIFFFASVRASLPWLRHKLGYWPTVFWAGLVPFVIWCIAVFGIGLMEKLLAAA
jgi:hypothetical protein